MVVSKWLCIFKLNYVALCSKRLSHIVYFAQAPTFISTHKNWFLLCIMIMLNTMHHSGSGTYPLESITWNSGSMTRNSDSAALLNSYTYGELNGGNSTHATSSSQWLTSDSSTDLQNAIMECFEQVPDLIASLTVGCVLKQQLFQLRDQIVFDFHHHCSFLLV